MTMPYHIFWRRRDLSPTFSATRLFCSWVNSINIHYCQCCNANVPIKHHQNMALSFVTTDNVVGAGLLLLYVSEHSNRLLLKDEQQLWEHTLCFVPVFKRLPTALHPRSGFAVNEELKWLVLSLLIGFIIACYLCNRNLMKSSRNKNRCKT